MTHDFVRLELDEVTESPTSILNPDLGVMCEAVVVIAWVNATCMGCGGIAEDVLFFQNMN